MNYRLTIYPAIEAGPSIQLSFLFETEKEMIAASETTADLLLYIQDRANLMKDYSNMFIKEQKIDGKWEETKS